MSVELKSVEGSVQQPRPGRGEVDIIPSELFITSYFGGKGKGKMLQLTPAHGFDQGYIQLDRGQVMDLVERLNSWLNNTY